MIRNICFAAFSSSLRYWEFMGSKGLCGIYLAYFRQPVSSVIIKFGGMIEIEKADFSKIQILQEISRSTFFETFAENNSESDMQQYLEVNFSLEKLATELGNENSLFYIAWDQASAIGYLKVNTGFAQTELHEDHSLEIERIYVLNAYHGKKVGQLLYEKAVEIAGQLTKTSVWLGVWEENPRAIRFYEKNGFVAFSTHIFKVGDDDQTDILMRKSL
jgi:diamine N-acetyltransferase